MAFTVSNQRNQSSAGPAASLVGATVTAAIGDMVVVNVAAANSGTSGAAVTTTCTDSAGNTYTQRTQVNKTDGVADDGITLTVFTSRLTNTLASGDITVSFSPDSAQGCAFTAVRYRPAGGETASFLAGGAGATGNSASPSITAPSVTNLDLIIGCLAGEHVASISDDADTTNGSWSTSYGASVGSGAAAAILRSQSKAVSATGAQTFNPTTSVAHDFAINYIILRSGEPVNNLSAAAGSYTVTGNTTDLRVVFPNKVAANVGAYSVNGSAATLIDSNPPIVLVAVAGSYSTDAEAAILDPLGDPPEQRRTMLRRVGDPLYHQFIIWSDFNLIYETDPDQFERLEYLVAKSPFTFRIHFRDIKTFDVTLGNDPFTMTNGSAVVRVAHPAHGRRTGEHVRFTSTTNAVGGIDLDGNAVYEREIVYVSDDTYDITHRTSVVLSGSPFATTNGTAVVRVTHSGHGRSTGTNVFFSDVNPVGGIKIAGNYSMTVINANTYDITHSSAATSTATSGGTSVTVTYDLPSTATGTGGGSSAVATYNEFNIIANSLFSYAEAEALALLVAPKLGKLPLLYRQNLNRVTINPGNTAFSAGEASFTLSADRIAVRIAYNDLEESCLHEATHAAIQEHYNGKGVPYIDHPGWAAAVAADDAFIDNYATTADQEDFAQSALASYAMLTHPERWGEPDRTLIANQIPNRIAFFRDVVWIDPVTACVRVPAANILPKLPASWIASLEDNVALASHCRDLANLKVEAYYSRPDLVAAGIPDLYKFFCNVCGRAHVRPCIGSEPRPFWDVR